LDFFVVVTVVDGFLGKRSLASKLKRLIAFFSVVVEIFSSFFSFDFVAVSHGEGVEEVVVC
jgi:hypothetical protein